MQGQGSVWGVLAGRCKVPGVPVSTGSRYDGCTQAPQLRLLHPGCSPAPTGASGRVAEPTLWLAVVVTRRLSHPAGLQQAEPRAYFRKINDTRRDQSFAWRVFARAWNAGVTGSSGSGRGGECWCGECWCGWRDSGMGMGCGAFQRGSPQPHHPSLAPCLPTLPATREMEPVTPGEAPDPRDLGTPAGPRAPCFPL